jgi:hypothetical protein
MHLQSGVGFPATIAERTFSKQFNAMTTQKLARWLDCNEPPDAMNAQNKTQSASGASAVTK